MAKSQQFIPQRPTGPTPKALRNQTPEERERAKNEPQEDPNLEPEAREAARAAAEYAAATGAVGEMGETSVLEDPDKLADRLEATEEFLERNRGLLFGLVGVVALVIAAFFGFRYWRSMQDETAQEKLFPSVYYFESDSLKQALNGDGQNPGLLTVADEYGSTNAGNLAHFYAGVALLKQGKYQEAADHLDKFSSDDLLLQARAYCLRGDAALELGQKEEAAKLYLKAADYKANNFYTPGYLMKAAVAQEEMKDYAGAVKTYDRILNDYPQSPENNDAKRYRARAAAMAGVE